MSTVTTSQPRTVAPPTIDRRTGLTRDEFVHHYRDRLLPVILTDATKDWPARTRFTFDFFRNQLGGREVIIQSKKYRLRDFIDILLTSTPERPAPYPCKLNMREGFADLISDVSPRYDLASPDRVGSPLLLKRFFNGLNDFEVFLGGPGGEFPYLHYDYLGLFAYINMMVGEKEFTIYSPDQAPYLYVDPETGWTSTIEDHHRPDLDRYPLFAKTTPIKVVLRAGETLFIPCGWWHTARSLTPSISVAFDQLCSSNWSFFVRDCLRLRRCGRLKLALSRAILAGTGLLLGAQERLRGRR